MKKACLLTFTIFSNLGLNLFAQYNMQGDGIEVGDNCYQLTAALEGQVSSIWYEELINLNEPFELQFTMNFGDINGEDGGTSGADGMMFVLQNESPTALGVVGQGLGYGLLSPSLGVEFDTYRNADLGDPYPDHIGIHTNGNTNHNTANSLSGPIQADAGDVDIEDGEDHAIAITWDPSTQNIKVYFDCEFRLDATIDLVNQIFDGNSEVWWGFTASTGGSYNVHSVCLYENVSPSGNVSICPGLSTQLVAGGDINAEFTWSPIDYLSDPTVFNPIATPPSSQVYTVIYTDFCGEVQSNTIEVTVEPIEAGIYAEDYTITCIQESIDITTYTNYDDATLVWSTIEGEELNITGANATATGSGTYEITYTSEDGNCFDTEQFSISVDTTSYSSIPGPAATLNCYEPTYTLQGSSNNDEVNFSWSTQDGEFFGGSFIPDPTVISAGTYSLTVTNPDNGCTSTSELIISEDFTEPVITLGYPDGVISCITPTIAILGNTIEPEGYTTDIEWTWSEGGGVIYPWELEPSITLPGDYTMMVTFEENGCTASATDSVTVEQDPYAFISLESLIMPNIFTPNGDGVNELLKPMFTDPELEGIDPLNSVDYYNLTIRDRWGHILHSSNGNPIGWNGIYSGGEKAHSGTYLLEVEYNSNCGEFQEGLYRGVLKIIAD